MQDGWKIAVAEKIQVVQKLVEIVDVAPKLIPWLKMHYLLVCSVKCGRESSEKLRHGKIGFMVSDIYRRIDEHGIAESIRHDIAVP